MRECYNLPKYIVFRCTTIFSVFYNTSPDLLRVGRLSPGEPEGVAPLPE
jgi:hypothetical protein